MKQLWQLLKMFFYNPKNVFLGRWKLERNPKIIHLRIDQANEDHCGCCNKE